MNDEHQAFVAHLIQADRTLLQLVEKHGPLAWPNPRPPFEALLRAIVGQQVSTQAATTIFGRFEGLLQGASWTPELLLSWEIERLRGVGLSSQKVRYVRAVAEAWMEHPDTYSKLDEFDDAKVVSALVDITGVGVWTAQMHLMFTLRRPDVFAPGDLGLKKAMANLYGLAMDSSEKSFSDKAQAWSPFRSLASLHLWRSLED